MLTLSSPSPDPALPSGAPAFQRARGRAGVSLERRRGATRLAGLAQAGSAKAFLPRVPGASGASGGGPEVVFLNTAGGLTGGDRLDYALELGAGGRATGTTQTAERAYAARPGSVPAEMQVTLRLGDGARLDWLPQETILFDGAALTRRTDAHLAGDATLLFCEALVLGRAAMGERVRTLSLFDRREIWRGQTPVLVDAVRMGDAALGTAPAGLGSARAVALLALVAPGAEDAVSALRPLLRQDGVRAAASGWDGRCLVRIMAEDGWPLRVALARLIRHLRSDSPGGGGDLPRVWQI